MHPYKLFCSKGLFGMGHSIIPTGRSSASKEQFFRWISNFFGSDPSFQWLSVRSDVSCWYFDHRSICIFKCYSSFV